MANSPQADSPQPPKRWSQQVNENSNALELEPGVFTWDDPHAIAVSLKASAECSVRRKTTPFASAMSMLNFYINRAGRQLTAERRAVLEAAKDELRALFGRPRRPAAGPGQPEPAGSSRDPRDEQPRQSSGAELG